jgi:hypothetical protein
MPSAHKKFLKSLGLSIILLGIIRPTWFAMSWMVIAKAGHTMSPIPQKWADAGSRYVLRKLQTRSVKVFG